MKKILYFDTETTGLNPQKNAVIQFAGIVEIDGNVQEEIEMKIAPMRDDVIEEKALEVHGMSVEQIKAFPSPKEQYEELKKILIKYVDPYNKNDKFTPAGYNVRFDMEMMHSFWKKNGDPYFGGLVNWKCIDALPIMYFLDFTEKVCLDDYKLSTVCDHYGISIKAHDALSDIRATREAILKIREKMDFCSRCDCPY
jgi:DNA polymerase-3 subunit epsilon